MTLYYIEFRILSCLFGIFYVSFRFLLIIIEMSTVTCNFSKIAFLNSHISVLKYITVKEQTGADIGLPYIF